MADSASTTCAPEPVSEMGIERGQAGHRLSRFTDPRWDPAHGGLRSDTCAAGAPGIASGTVTPPPVVPVDRKTLEEILAALEGMATLIRRAMERAS